MTAKKKANKKPEPVPECIQCQGDEMLDVRNAARELHDIMDLLCNRFGDKHAKGISVYTFVTALIDAYEDGEALKASERNRCERKLKEANDLIASLRFMASVCDGDSSGVHIGVSGTATVTLSRVFQTAVKRIQSLIAYEQGIENGSNKRYDTDPLEYVWKVDS